MDLDGVDIHGREAAAKALLLSAITVSDQFTRSSTETGNSRRGFLSGSFLQQIVAEGDGGVFKQISEVQTSRRSVLKGMARTAVELMSGNVERLLGSAFDDTASVTKHDDGGSLGIPVVHMVGYTGDIGTFYYKSLDDVPNCYKHLARGLNK